MPTKKLKNKPSFSDQVRAIVKQISPGQTMSYKTVATLCHNPKGARAVARVMAANFDKSIPCHRIIHSDGKIGEYNRGGNQAKIALLRKEGCVIRQGYISTGETR